MKKNEVQIGQSYKVKVSGNIAEVRITGENPRGGWEGVNVATNRAVHIKSAQRIRSLVNRPAKRQVVKTLEEAAASATPIKMVMTKAEYEGQADKPTGDVAQVRRSPPKRPTLPRPRPNAPRANLASSAQWPGCRGSRPGRGGNGPEHEGDGREDAFFRQMDHQRQNPCRHHLRRDHPRDRRQRRPGAVPQGRARQV